MKKILLLAIISLMGLCSLIYGEEVSPWTEKIEKIHQGMGRDEVEKILPPIDRCGKDIFGQGGGQVVSYWLDDKWKVSITYDYEGIPRNKDGNALNNYSPNNKVLSKPTLKRKDCKVTTITSIDAVPKNGIHREYFENGETRKELNYKDGKKDGSFKQYYRNGGLFREGTYKNDKWEGVLKQYQENGKLGSEQNYENGQIVWTKTYYDNGKISGERVYESGKNISWKQYDKEGNLISEITDSWGTYSNPESVGAVQLTKLELFPNEHKDVVADVIEKLKKDNEEPSEFYISIYPSQESFQLKIDVWHYDSFLDIYKNTLGNPGGKNHTIYYDLKQKKIRKSLFWQ